MANTAFTHDPTITVPSPTVNNRVVTWNGTTGKVFDNVATVTINAGVVAGVTALTVDDLTIDGTSITTIASNNDINITPHGTGATVITKLKITASAGASKVLTSDSAGVATWEAAAASGVSNPLTSGSFVLNDNAKLGLGTSSGESAIYSDGTNVYWDTGDDVPIIFRDVTTNSTTKASRIGFGHYTNSEEPVMMMSGNSISSGNALYIGGGRNNMNAVTSIDFYTAANGTTTGGTSRLLINSAGEVIITSDGTVVDNTDSSGITSVTQGVAKAWCTITGSGSLRSGGSYNISAVANTSTGLRTVSFANDFSSTVYTVTGVCAGNDTQHQLTYPEFPGSVGSIRIFVYRGNPTLSLQSIGTTHAFFGAQ